LDIINKISILKDGSLQNGYKKGLIYHISCYIIYKEK